ncbi:hypothetical protein BGZ57DRAFT_893108 [Hyaloscypha finlandica]|nr:hypothetical protein BGZ57DRAFT_893108 [Hyaloscypha finlandica]
MRDGEARLFLKMRLLMAWWSGGVSGSSDGAYEAKNHESRSLHCVDFTCFRSKPSSRLLCSISPQCPNISQ